MASADTLLILTPHSFVIPTGDPAAYSSRNGHPVLAYDDTTNENAIASCLMPQHYAGGGVTVYLHYSMASATSNTVDWDVAFERIGDQQLDIDADSFASAQSVDDTTVPGTSGFVDVVSVAFTDGAQMDSVATGEAFRIKVTRDAGSDDATGDAELHRVEIRET
jgi:hypothetical protein